MKSGARQGARPRRSLGYGEVEQRGMASDFAANYRANFRLSILDPDDSAPIATDVASCHSLVTRREAPPVNGPLFQPSSSTFQLSSVFCLLITAPRRPANS